MITCVVPYHHFLLPIPFFKPVSLSDRSSVFFVGSVFPYFLAACRRRMGTRGRLALPIGAEGCGDCSSAVAFFGSLF